jgi:hypothetical protein
LEYLVSCGPAKPALSDHALRAWIVDSHSKRPKGPNKKGKNPTKVDDTSWWDDLLEMTIPIPFVIPYPGANPV